MQTFAVIILIVGIIALTHVHNWVLRKIWEDDENVGLSFFITGCYIGIMFFAFKYLILWSYPLIVK